MASTWSYKSFRQVLNPLVEFIALICFLDLGCEVLFELGDYCVNIVGIFTFGILKCVENL